MNNKLLTADIGGTHSRFMAFNGVTPQEFIDYDSRNFKSFEHLLTEVFEQHPSLFQCHTSCFAIAGIRDSDHFKVTNLPWTIDCKKTAKTFGLNKLFFLNDLQASAYGVSLLPPESFKVLQKGKTVLGEGNIGLISPGTGLGESFLSPEGIAFHTEGGHVDFAPQDDLQIELWRFLKQQLGRVSSENVLSGPGIWLIYSFLKSKDSNPTTYTPRNQQDIRVGAFLFHDHLCIQTLKLFVKCLAQEAGNFALHTLARKGLFIGGGITPHLLPYLEEESFLESFCQKGPLTPFLQSIPIKVILDQRCPLFGCAWFCLHGNN